MFEGLVRQLLLGYLGRYVKDIQRDQLKITLWHEEVLLENVELILEAFDYLRLPFALKEGRVGRLSIRIPWKKLGWDPIIIILEDVFVLASPRDDEEWRLAAVEQREFASKKAKLAAAELAKLSRRVCDNQAGESFISYITAKILDSIQVSIRNFHVVYRDLYCGLPSNSAQFMLGLKFSSLAIMKQTSPGTRGLVSKMVEITGLEIYCSSSNGNLSLLTRDNVQDSKDLRNSRYEGNAYDHILAPLDASLSLLVDRSGKLDSDAPQYSINAEVTNLMFSLDEVQLQYILIIWDNLCTYQLREKYGRYRPWSCPLSRKPANWQKVWWRYAQESVLSDVRKTLRKTSWRFFGERLSCRRRYVDLYKKKLIFLRQEQSIDEEILLELEQMEKDSDVDDILSYRAVAEHKLQELPVNSSDSNSGFNSLEKSRNLDQSSSRPRGWLNWLSRGMLGAGGTEDSSQFSGVVSDEVIKDIYEATEFQPSASTNGPVVTDDKLYRCAVKFCIHEIAALLRSTKSKTDTAKLILNEAAVEYKVREESSSVDALLNSISIISPHDERAILLSKRDSSQPSCRIHMDLSPSQEVQVSIKIAVEPLLLSLDAAFFRNCMEFYEVLEYVEFQHERVISSLNGIRNSRARVQSKTEYILSTRERVTLDVRVNNVTVSIPWTNTSLEHSEMVLGLRALVFSSDSEQDDWSDVPDDILMPVAECNFSSLQHHLYDHFEVKIDDAEVKIIRNSYSKPVTVLEKFSASVGVASCFIQDESIPKQLEVRIKAPIVYVHFSLSIFIAAMELILYLDDMHQKTQPVSLRSPDSGHTISDHVKSSIFGFSLAANLGAVTIHFDLEKDEGNSTSCMVSLNATDIRFESTELLNCWIFSKAVEITSCSLNDDRDRCTLCLFGSVSENVPQHDMNSRVYNKISKKNDQRISANGCFLLHYEACRKEDFSLEKCTISLSDGELHCYPHIIGLMIGFSDRIAEYARLHVQKSSGHSLDEKAQRQVPDLENKKFGFSNFLEPECSKSASIPASQFPFITIDNSGQLRSLEDSLLYGLSDWRKKFSPCGRSGGVKFTKDNVSNGYLSSSLEPASSGSGQFIAEFNMCGIRVHFHDSSCIIGTITVHTISSKVFVYEEFVDIFCSTEGLMLKSSCWRQGLLEFLWGPALRDFSPILNVRVRIPTTHKNPQLEVSIGVQHVCCILPTEYLALLIGYFSLPDWTINPKQQLDERSSSHTDDESPMTFKIEILDSDLIIPTEEKAFQFLGLEIPQLYCDIILDNSSVAVEDIPSHLVDGCKIAERSQAFNVFGRQLYLSLLLLKDEDCLPKFDRDAVSRKLTLIAPLSADVWIRVPRENESSSDCSVTPVCIMARIDNCELIADESYLFDGLDGVVNVINQFSAIEDRSKAFTGNALQFLKSNSCREKDLTASADVSSSGLMEISLFVNSSRIKLHHTAQDSAACEPVAMAEMQLTCSISLRHEMPQHLEISFSSFVIYSLSSSAILARCSPAGYDSSVLGITLSVLEQVRNDISFSLPSLELWFEYLDWVKFLDALRSLVEEQGRTANTGALLNSSTSSVLHTESAASESNGLVTSSDSNFVGMVKRETSFVTVRTENMGLTCHFPFALNRDSIQGSGNGTFPLAENQHLSHCKFASVTINTRSAWLSLNSRGSKFKSCIENVSASVGISPEKCLRSSPFFQIIQVTFEAEICNRTDELVDISAEVGCDRIEFGLSHQVFYFWHDIELNILEAGPSQISIGCIDCNLNIRKVSLLVTDGRWTCNGPLLEVLVRNFVLQAKASETVVESSIWSDIQVNYNNIHKVMWEPFIEPWNFQMRLTRKREISVLLKSSIVTDIHLKSMAQLNLNITESFFECVCRTIEMINDALGLARPDVISKSSSFLNPQLTETISAGRYAPYILQNLTSLRLAYHTFLGPSNLNDLDTGEMKDWHYVQPGSSVPIYIDETPEEQLLRFRPAASSDRLNENQLSGAAHHFIMIQLEGTSTPSVPMSMDLVGLSYFQVDFSKTSSLELGTVGSRPAAGPEDDHNDRASDGFVIPVVFDVSVQRFSKLIQLYSTVIVENETSVPLELRFDIPLGVSPKIVDPILPGEKYPLPLHLAQPGRVRWRPQGNSYVWSETQILRNILSQDSRIGFLRSFVCYPSHPSSNPFRCCLSVRKICLHSVEKPKKGTSLHARSTPKRSGERDGLLLGSDKSKNQFVYQLTLITPLVVHNYLPEVVSLTIESGGVKHASLLSEVATSFYHIDPSHELGLNFHLQGYKTSVSRFPDAEAFVTLAKFTGTKFILSETLSFEADVGKGPINATLEKKLDAFSGARELFVYVPFLLYNCLGFPLCLADSASEVASGTVCTIPSCYDLVEEEPIQMKMDGLGLLSSSEDYKNGSPNSAVISTRRFVNMPTGGMASVVNLRKKNYVENPGEWIGNSTNRTCPTNISDLRNSCVVDNEGAKVRAFAYVPKLSSYSSDNMVRVRRSFLESVGGKQLGFSWSDPFPLDPASGSTTVLVPQRIQNAAYVVSVNSTALSEPFAGRTRAISFQPRYVISNACSKELCYKQKGTDSVFHLGVGQHSHLHWTDTTRDLLVSIHYNEPGCEWSGSFLPDILADTQVKMRNYISGELNMIRVEVQNADVSIREEKIVASIHGNSGTNLILLSDDDSGYMPYRIENFSKERLRIYQLRCENFETIVHSYQCHPYAWDEPCYPHRLVLEVPGERVLGSYALDDVKQTMKVHLPATTEKPERTLLISAHAEGATKVLSIIDSSYHVFRDLKSLSNNVTGEKKKPEEKRDTSDYNEKVSITIPYIGVSLINSNSQELLFVCIKGMTVDLLQSMDQQKLSFQVSSLQIDNQLHTTQYPVILSFDHDSRSKSYGLKDGGQNKCEDLQIHSHSSCESVICLAVSKWRKKDVPVISFEYIIFRVAEFHLELEQEVVLSVADLLRTIYLRLQSGVLPISDTEPPVLYDISLLEDPHPLVPNLNTSIPSIKSGNRSLLPSVIPIGAPWQQIYHLARRQKKIYVELFDLASVRFTLSFSSAPWMLRFGIPTSGDSLMQRGLMALADIEGARIYLKELTISHHMASWESIQEILFRHYARQLLHEMYKVLGSAGVIGNPIGFARSLSLGIKDFLSVPTRNVLQD
ncbi:uncharacterized protein LOC116188354 isoform X3 [Punica granatum]|uniref:Uncharacterized protein LOC116188354 isoform X3 n=1 Tax=Punica granatum TaxID=22663 RepID=A0A6P8BT64_PUNGR|nr:uncharacterized protein LOC116188354 isoform X3 [Punica granatum]